jgi:hypothetical protein
MMSGRSSIVRSVCLGVAFAAAAATAQAQSSFKVGEKEVQVHGSFQQGFVVSDTNNFLTMKTSEGSGAMTDTSLNMSSQLTRKLRVGGQIYSRNIGELSNGQLQMDWLFADYRFNDYVGVRAGKVKTALGLFNDTQDMEFLYTWALLPQGIYPLDLRGVSIAHRGLDVYGKLPVSAKAGVFEYTAYFGEFQDDTRGGYRYGLEDQGMRFTSPAHKHGYGADLRWRTPVDGLMAGYSFNRTEVELDMFLPASAMMPFSMDVTVEIPSDRQHAIFADFQRDRLRFSAEWRRESLEAIITPAFNPPTETGTSGWLAAGSYRLHDRVELGAYRTQHVPNTTLSSSSDDNHIYDTAVSARFDVTSFWHVKTEAHFMDGYGGQGVPRGFYVRSNRNGFEPTTKMLVVRTGISF